MMTDTDTAAHLAEITKGVLANLHLLTPDPIEKAAALTTALSYVIERMVGSDQAPGRLLALIAPQLNEWTERQDPRTVQ